MISSAFKFVFVCAIALSSVAFAQSHACRKAFRECEFRFEGYDYLRAFSIDTKPDMAFTPRIVAKNRMILGGVFNSNGREAEFINRDGTVVPISKATAARKRLSPTHFKPFYLSRKGGSGIGHQTFVYNQMAVSRGRCVRVYFTQYQILKSRKPYVVKENVYTRKRSKCVVFMTK